MAIGCPMSHRGWIIAHWLAAIRRQETLADEVTIVAVGDLTDPMFAVLQSDLLDTEYTFERIHVDENRKGDHREWSLDRYQHMAKLRNCLLDQVRRIAPDYFVSVDSDILLHPHALTSALDALSTTGADAMGLACYLEPSGTRTTNAATFTFENLFQRIPVTGGVVRAEILMAAKVLTPNAYAHNYQTDIHGEDVGLARTWRDAGVKAFWDSRVVNKHVMSEAALSRVDQRVGY